MTVEVTQLFKVKCTNCSFRQSGLTTKETAVQSATEHLADWREGATWHEVKILEVTIVKKNENEDDN